jgi:hypothetical protein
MAGEISSIVFKFKRSSLQAPAFRTRLQHTHITHASGFLSFCFKATRGAKRYAPGAWIGKVCRPGPLSTRSQAEAETIRNVSRQIIYYVWDTLTLLFMVIEETIFDDMVDRGTGHAR